MSSTPADPPSLGPRDLISLEAGDTRALIAPVVGANCIAFKVASRDIIESPRSLEDLVAAPLRTGCPVLFPFPGKLPQGRYRFDGIERSLALNGPGGVHLHGFLAGRAGRLTERSATSCSVVFDDSMLDDDDRVGYPWPFRVVVRWSIAPSVLRADLRVDNPGSNALPFGFGLHPYLLPGPDWAVNAPASLVRPNVLGVTSGDPRPTSGPWTAAMLNPTLFLTGLPATDVDVALADLRVRFPAACFTELVLHRPSERLSISVEPWTSASTAGALFEAGGPHGLRRLGPGDAWTAWIEIVLVR